MTIADFNVEKTMKNNLPSKVIFVVKVDMTSEEVIFVVKIDMTS